MLNQCTSSCNSGNDIDCATCKLAELKNRKKSAENKKLATQQKNDVSVVPEDDDYSISEQLTQNGRDNTILYLVFIAFAMFLLILLFSWIIG